MRSSQSSSVGILCQNKTLYVFCKIFVSLMIRKYTSIITNMYGMRHYHYTSCVPSHTIHHFAICHTNLKNNHEIGQYLIQSILPKITTLRALSILSNWIIQLEILKHSIQHALLEKMIELSAKKDIDIDGSSIALFLNSLSRNHSIHEQHLYQKAIDSCISPWIVNDPTIWLDCRPRVLLVCIESLHKLHIHSRDLWNIFYACSAIRHSAYEAEEWEFMNRCFISKTLPMLPLTTQKKNVHA